MRPATRGWGIAALVLACAGLGLGSVALRQGSLRPAGTLSHPGAGGTNVFIDRHNDIVGVVLEIASVLSEDVEPLLGVFDRLENVIYSAIED